MGGSDFCWIMLFEFVKFEFEDECVFEEDVVFKENDEVFE